MKRFLPIFLVLVILGAGAYFVLNDNSNLSKTKNQDIKKQNFVLKEFTKPKNCARIPNFLNKLGINRPIIDLSQEKYTGIAFYYGKNFSKVLHKKQWEQYEHLGTYALDEKGNIFLTPNPFISIKPTTFNLQKAIYKLDSNSAKLSLWLKIDEISPNSLNPYGLISIVYDCSGNLYVSAIDKSNYKEQKGRIYKIDIKTKEYKKIIENFDALTINFIEIEGKKYLIAASARDNGVYLFVNNKPIKLFKLPDPNLRVRKIKVLGKNSLKVEAIKFNYSLIAQTTNKQREIFVIKYNKNVKKWEIIKK
jgi:hypothetical protein